MLTDLFGSISCILALLNFLLRTAKASFCNQKDTVCPSKSLHAAKCLKLSLKPALNVQATKMLSSMGPDCLARAVLHPHLEKCIFL